MTSVYCRQQIESVIQRGPVIAAMERAFVAYSRGEAVVPPPGHLDFVDPPGDCHIKFGYLQRGASFVVKIATGFWENRQKGLPSGSGVILVFSKSTGALLTILQDEGYLTDVRTAAAGAVAAKYLAPSRIERIAVIGTGVQARLQLEYLAEVTSCRRAAVWGRTAAHAAALVVPGFDIEVCRTVAEAVAGAQLIVTTTASRQWLVGSGQIAGPVHITAVGADGGGKRELDPELFARADICAVDSVAQCSAYGDSAEALGRGLIDIGKLVELGRLIEDQSLRRREASAITIADLTGVAVQDIAVADLALEGLQRVPVSP